MPSEDPDDLGERIAAARASHAARTALERGKQENAAGSTSAGAYAMRFGIEFVACVFVGGFLGYWLDRMAGTAPWGLLGLGTLGLAAGVRSVIRAYRELNARAMKVSPAEPPATAATPDRTTD